MQTAGALGGIAASFVRVPTEVNDFFFFFEIFSFLNIMILLLLSFLILPVQDIPFVNLLIALGFLTLQVIKQRMQTRQFASAPDAVRLIVSKEGFKGLYAVCQFFNVTYLVHYCFQVFLVSRVQLSHDRYNIGLFYCNMGILQGYGSFLLRDLPFDAIQFCIYEQLRIGYKLAVSILLSKMLRPTSQSII